MYYSEEVLRQVREANDIVSVISGYVSLTKKGANHFGLCPFHGEKTPSFSVNEREQFFHCFGCHAGGNVFTFIMKIENLDFVESVKFLADRAHITLPEAEISPEEKKRAYRRSRMLEAAAETARFYYYHLTRTPGGRNALEYLDKRAVTETYRKKFGLGYAPVSRGALAAHLKSKGFEEEDLLAAGLLSGKPGSTYDRFFNRLMFPIFDAQGRVIAFGGRVMGQGEPKYLNSSDSEIFNKRRNLYGLSIAKKTKRDHLLMVEGYMDVLSLHQAGFDNAVASLGTALTPEQASLMKRYNDQVILCYDSDRAGTNAARRAIPILEKAGLRVKVIRVPGAKDPDELIRENGRDAFEQAILSAMDPIDFEMLVLEQENGSKVEGQIKTVHDMAKRLAEIESDLDRELHIRDVAARMKTSEKALTAEVEQIRSTTGLLEYRSERRQERDRENAILKERIDAEGQLLCALIKKPELYGYIRPYLSLTDFSKDDPFHYTMADYVLSHLATVRSVSLADLCSQYPSVEEQTRAAKLYEFELPKDREDLGKFLTQTIRSVKQKRIADLSSSEDPEELVRMIDMKKQLNSLIINIS
ncbi:MAG: DNA primase [Firmicutes bacterium]|nr:DNA primase [Bacillota bacterium]